MDQQSELAPYLEQAGITINGPNPWDPQIRNPAFWNRLYSQGSLGLGEAYMDGWWECEDLAEFFNRVVGANLEDKIRVTPNLIWQIAQAKFLNMQTISKAKRVAKLHYSETDAYKASLDKRMTGSCGYWPAGVTNVDEAQEAKKRHIAAKLLIVPGMRVLDIGCGWGGMALYLARHTGARVTGITLSSEQLAVARQRAEEAELADRVTFELRDYREFATAHRGAFDRIVSVGMFEHVGVPHYSDYFAAVREMLNDEGVALIHSIGPGSTFRHCRVISSAARLRKPRSSL